MRISRTKSGRSLHPPAMSAEPKPDFSEFGEFGDVLRKQWRRSENVVRRAPNRAKAQYPVPFDELNDVSRALDNALNVVECDIEELRIHRTTRCSRRGRTSRTRTRSSEWPATLIAKDGTSSRQFGCRMRIRAVAASGSSSPPVLYWNFTEETDEDLF